MKLPEIPVAAANPCLSNGCAACCMDTQMLLTQADIERLSGGPVEDFWFTAEDGFRQLRTQEAPGRPCVFLDEAGRCRVHGKRPEGCRLYPAVWEGDLRKAALDATYCPHTAGFRLDSGTAEAVRRLAVRLERERTVGDALM
ncbi:MAG: YkgJ family cysteine cluster protein [Thermoplasmatota archaeon]